MRGDVLPLRLLPSFAPRHGSSVSIIPDTVPLLLFYSSGCMRGPTNHRQTDSRMRHLSFLSRRVPRRALGARKKGDACPFYVSSLSFIRIMQTVVGRELKERACHEIHAGIQRERSFGWDARGTLNATRKRQASVCLA